MDYQNNDVRELGWDDEIENDGEDFAVLPEGDYDFVITKFERKRYAGSASIPPCNMGEITIRINTDHGVSCPTERLYLLSKFEWKLCQFFTCIGQRKHGEKLKPDWSKLLGATGRCRLVVNKYTDKNGKDRENNRVDKWLEPEESSSAKGFTPGEF